MCIRTGKKSSSFAGIYEAKNLGVITELLQFHQLAASDSVLVWSVAGEPVKGWESTVTGKIFNKVGKNVPTGTKLSSKGNVTTISLRKEINSAQAPPTDGSNNCLDWYWVTVDPDTGIITSCEYLYTTCPDPTTGVGGSDESSQQNNDCNYSEEDADEVISEFVSNGDATPIAFSQDPTDVYGNPDGGSTTENGVLVRPANPTIEFYRTKIVLLGINISYTAHFAGVQFKKNSDSWKFQSLTYSSTTDDGYLPPCFETGSSFSPALAWASDSTSVAVGYSASTNLSVECFGYKQKLGGSNIITGSGTFYASKIYNGL